MSNRRRFERHTIQVPISLSTPVRSDRAGVLRDLSLGGALFHSRSRFEVGERLALVFEIERHTGSTCGLVVRTTTDDNIETPFRFLTAVRFDAPLIELRLPIPGDGVDTDVDRPALRR